MLTLMVIFGVATGLLLLITVVSRLTRTHTRSAEGSGHNSYYMFVGSGAEFSDSSDCSNGSSGGDGGGCSDGGGGGGGD